MRRFFGASLLLALPVAAFTAGFAFTEAAFRAKKIPFPHELFALAAGLACLCWMMALISLFRK